MTQRTNGERLLRLYILLCMCILTYTAKAQFAPLPANSTAPMPWFHQQFVGADGAPLVGGLVYTYVSNSSVQHPSYRDSGGTLNQNPIQLDSGGYADIWLDNTAYRICVYDSSSVLQFCKDNITAAPAVLGQTYAQLAAGNVFSGGAQVIGPQGTATAGTNFDSHSFRLRGTFWNGTASANDDWLFVGKMGGGTNPNSILSITHSGTSGSASLDLSTLNSALLPPLSNQQFSTGINNNGSGLKHKRVAGCTTGSTQYATCDVVVTWITPFADANYTASCIGDLISVVAVLQGISAKTASAINVRTFKGDAGGSPAAFTTIDCIAVHD